MIKQISIFCACLFLFSCGKPYSNLELSSSSIPDCIQDFIDANNFSVSLKTVKRQTLNGEVHYWMNTDATHFDGVEFIFNEFCEQVCFFCGACLPPECSFEYDFEAWEVVWEE